MFFHFHKLEKCRPGCDLRFQECSTWTNCYSYSELCEKTDINTECRYCLSIWSIFSTTSILSKLRDLVKIVKSQTIKLLCCFNISILCTSPISCVIFMLDGLFLHAWSTCWKEFLSFVWTFFFALFLILQGFWCYVQFVNIAKLNQKHKRNKN